MYHIVESLLKLRADLQKRIENGRAVISCEGVVMELDNICGYEMDKLEEIMKDDGSWESFLGVQK